jgi:signal transduction histidine kinase
MTELDKQAAGIKSEADAGTQRALAESNTDVTNPEAEIRAVVADYEARMDEVAQVIARVRHEINNPLTGVLGQAQLLLREELSEKTRKRVETIEQLAIRLRDIVSQLRQVQKTFKN